jgi:hypothetical protein
MATPPQEQQLELDIPERRTSSWRLDPRTIERGKEGLRAAREALREGQAKRAAHGHKHAA